MKIKRILSLALSVCMTAGTIISAAPESVLASPIETNLDSSYVDPWGGG